MTFDQLIVVIPEDVEPNDPVTREHLDRLAVRSLAEQYDGPVVIIAEVTWHITNDPDELDSLLNPGDGCAKCIAGNDQARAFMRDRPGRYIAIADIEYAESQP